MRLKQPLPNLGFTLVELMTVLFIIIMLAMVGFPTYQEYQNRANLAEAETTIGTMEKHLRTYYLDHGSFYSAAPNPATVPGLASLGSSSTFTSSGGWSTIGPPMPDGSTVTFSYQAFAGQTPAGSTTPVTSTGFYNPTDDMNLIRRTATSYNEYHFPQVTRVAFNETPLKLDWSDFNFCASAQETYSTCYGACIQGGTDYKTCQSTCTDKVGAPTGTPIDTCSSTCQAAGLNPTDCDNQCGVAGDGSCSGDLLDIDCYSNATGKSSGASQQDQCVSACVNAGNGDSKSCGDICTRNTDSNCPESPDLYDPDCFPAPTNNNDTTAQQACEAAATVEGTDPKECSKPGDGRCSGYQGDIDCYQDANSGQVSACISACVAHVGGSEVTGATEGCTARCNMSDGQCGSGNMAGEEWADYDCYGSGGGAGACTGSVDPKTGQCYAGGSCEDTCIKNSGDGKDPSACLAGCSGDSVGDGGNAGGGSSGGGDSGGYYSGSGDAGGGTSGGGGSTSSGSGGTVTTSSSECASFGVSKATDFGIQQNVPGYNWVVMTAVGNFSPGTTCTLAAKVIQVVNGQVSQSGDFMKFNVGE